jgi:hypothetical protein
VNEIFGIVYCCRLKDRISDAVSLACFQVVTGKWEKLGAPFKVLNGSKLGRGNFLHFVTAI